MTSLSSIRRVVQRSKASQNREELWRLLNLLNTNPPSVVVNIGIDQGYLLDVWRELFDPTLLIGIDIRVPNRKLTLEQRADRDARFLFSDSNDLWTRDCLVKEYLGNRTIDLLFIDGSHTYEGVKRDFELYSGLVTKGGFIVFHDIKLKGPQWEGLVEVNKLWKELKPNYEHREFWDQAGQGTGTGVLIWK